VVTDNNGCASEVTIDNLLANNCPADFDQNSSVGVSDLILFNAAYGCTSNCCPYDLNGDSVVTIGDLLGFISVFGSMCE
jgi:hypothetical protein